MKAPASNTSWRLIPGAVVPKCSVEKVSLGITQNSLENTCARASFLIKLQAFGLELY